MIYLDEIFAKTKFKKIRIFRPQEWDSFVNSISNAKTRTVYQSLFYSAMRYAELARLVENSEWFHPQKRYIDLPFMAEKKNKQGLKGRYIWLTPMGVEVIRTLTEQYERLDDVTIFWQRLQTAKKNFSVSGYLAEGISPKSPRKTYESYLVLTYQQKRFSEICLSLGHTELTALKYYLNLPFSTEDKQLMRKYVEGWGP